MPFRKEFKQSSVERMRFLEQYDDWVSLREGHLLETKPVHFGNLRWIPVQMPKEMQVDLTNLKFFLKIMNIKGSIFLGNYIDERSNRYMSSLPSSGGAGVISDLFGTDKPKEYFVKRDHEDYQIFIDFGALKQKAESKDADFAQLMDREFKNVLIDIMWQDFFRINAMELFNFLQAAPFLVIGLLKSFSTPEERTLFDVIIEVNARYLWWAFWTVLLPRILQEKSGFDQQFEDFIKVKKILPQFLLADDHPKLLKYLVRFADLRSFSQATIRTYIAQDIKHEPRRLIRSERQAREEKETLCW